MWLWDFFPLKQIPVHKCILKTAFGPQFNNRIFQNINKKQRIQIICLIYNWKLQSSFNFFGTIYICSVFFSFQTLMRIKILLLSMKRWGIYSYFCIFKNWSIEIYIHLCKSIAKYGCVKVWTHWVYDMRSRMCVLHVFEDIAMLTLYKQGGASSFRSSSTVY